MDEGEEMAAPNEGPDNVPDDSQLTMPPEGEIYMPEEGADIHAEATQYEEIETEQTGVQVTSEVVETAVYQETVEYESGDLTTVEEEVYEAEVQEEEYVDDEVDDEARHEESDDAGEGGKEQEGSEPEEEAAVDVGDVLASSEASDATAVEVSKEAEGEPFPTIEEEPQKVEEEPPPPPPKPVEPPFKFEVVMKSQGEGKTEFDLILTKKCGMLWGFKIKGGRDLDIPLEVKEVRAGTIAEKAGLKVEDMIVAINDENILDLCHRHACRTILDAGDNLKLGVLSDIDSGMGEAVLTTIESAQSALADSRAVVSFIQNEIKRADDPNVSIQIKEAYKKVQVQVTEEYQLVDNDPTTLGINVRKSEEGEVAVIIKGQVLDDDEAALLAMKKSFKHEVTVETGGEKENEAPPPPPPLPVEDKIPEVEGMGSVQEGKTVSPQHVMWVANVSATSTTPEPTQEPTEEPRTEAAAEPRTEATTAQDGTPISPTVPALPEPVVVSVPTEEVIKEVSENAGVVPSTPEGLKGDYEPVEVEPQEKGYELIIGKIQYVQPPERPYSKCYFYQPKHGGMRKKTWPPKSNVSTVIVKPRIIREDELHRDRSATPASRSAKVTSWPPASASQPTAFARASPIPQHTPEPVPVSGQVASEPVQSSAAMADEAKEQTSVMETPQAVMQSDIVPASDPVEAKPPAEGESPVVTSAEAAPLQTSENPVGSPPEVSQNGEAMDVPVQQESNVEQSAEAAPEPQSA